MAHLEYLRDVAFPLHARTAPRPRGVPARVRQAGRRAGPAGQGRPLRLPELPQGPHRRPRGAARTRPSWPARPRPRRAPRADRRRPREEGRLRRAWDKIAEAAEGRGRDRQAVQLRSSAASPSTRSSSRSPGPSSAWPRRRPSPTPTGSASTATPASSRSSSPSSPTPRSTPSTRRPSSPTRSPTGRRAGPDDPLVERVLRGRTPEQAAEELVDGTKLADVAVRKKLAEGGKAAIDGVDDPMIKLALAVDADARAVRKRVEDEVEGVQTAQYAADRQGDLRGPGRLGLPRRHVHPPPGLRDRQGLRGATARPSPPSPRSAAPSSTPRRTATRPPYAAARRAGSRRRRPAGSSSTRRLTSSPRPTSSAATPAARSSTATTRSSA